MSSMYGVIEKLCQQRSMKVGRLCTELGISRGTMGDLKAGRTQSLSKATVEKIADYFGVSVDYLYGRTETQRSDAAASGLSDVYFSLAKEMQDNELDPDDVKAFIKIIKKNEKLRNESHDKG